MLFIHRPRRSWDLDEIQFSTWQGAVERHVTHLLNAHLDAHDDQRPNEPKEKLTFNRSYHYEREMNLVFGR